jgi:hypothetical protein
VLAIDVFELISDCGIVRDTVDFMDVAQLRLQGAEMMRVVADPVVIYSCTVSQVRCLLNWRKLTSTDFAGRQERRQR